MRFSECVAEQGLKLVEGDVSLGTYSATLTVPGGAPPRLGELFTIEWVIEVKIDKRFRRDVVARAPITVLPSPPSLEPSRFGSVSGSFRAEVNLSTSAVLPGAPVVADLSITSYKKLKCEELKVSLLRREEVVARRVTAVPSADDLRCDSVREKVYWSTTLLRDVVIDPSNPLSTPITIELPPSEESTVDTQVVKSKLILKVECRRKDFLAGTESLEISIPVARR